MASRARVNLPRVRLTLLAPLLAQAVLFQPAVPAAAQDAPPDSGGAAPPGEPEAAPAPPPADPMLAQREALFDIAFDALAAGQLPLAEEAFARAALLPGDPVRASVARSFAERVRRLGAQRALAASRPATSAAAVVARPATPVVEPASTEAARVAFLATTTATGLAAWGWTLPLALGIDVGREPRAFVGLYMVTTGAAFGIPFFLTREQGVTPGQANLAFYGATRGLWHGLLFSSILAGDVNPDGTQRGWAASLFLGSVSEMVAGYLVAGRADLTAGEARTIAVGGDFGLGLGFGIGALLGLHHDDHSSDAQARGMATAGFLGASAGLAGGALLAARRANTWGDGEVLRAAGLLGTYLGLTADALFDWDPSSSQDEKKALTTLMLGAGVGLWVGDRLVLATDFSVGQSILVDLSTVAGGLGAAGIAYLVAGGSSGITLKGITSTSAAGALLGFGLSYAYLRDHHGDHDADARRADPRGSGVALIPTFGANGSRGVALAGAF